jgi:hypothetical protein
MTFQPTSKPSTIIPDSLDYSALTFNSQVTMPGLDSTVMSGSTEQLAFRTAIASSMVGVRTGDVMIMSTSSINVRRGLNEFNFVDISDTEILDAEHLSRTLVAGTSILWNVSVPLRLGASGTNAYLSMKNGLTTAMGTGSFLTSIKKLSPSFDSVSTTSITVNAMSVVTGIYIYIYV